MPDHGPMTALSHTARPCWGRLFAFTLVSLAPDASAQTAPQTNWACVSNCGFPTSPSPSPREPRTLAYDASRDRVILFGGYAATQIYYGDTWEWNGTGWTMSTSGVAPKARSGHAMVYDDRRRRVILYGGGTGTAWLSDTWAWDGTTWAALTPTGPGGQSPPARHRHALAYDAARDRVVLFGGRTGGGLLLNDTWEWDGSNWALIPVSPASAPAPRQFLSMAYDSRLQRVILFGGDRGSGGGPSSGTWCWDGASWTLLRPRTTTPPARYAASLWYDERRDRRVLFGGTNNSKPFGDTWEWDGSDWVMVTPATAPSNRAFHAAAWDSLRRQAVLFGGNVSPQASPQTIALDLDDTWTYAPLQPGSFTPFGTGCAGTGGIPVLSSPSPIPPWIGDVFPIELDNLGPNLLATPFLVFGLDSLSPPLALAPIGMPSCFLYTTPVFAAVMSRTGAAARLDVQIPANPALAWAPLYLQGSVQSIGANPLGLVVSNAAAVRIGVR